MNFTEIGTYIHNGEQKEFHYSPSATYAEKTTFVKTVIDSVFVDGNYISLLKDVIFNFALVQMFTDIDLPSDDIDEFDTFDKETNIVTRLKEALSETNYNLVGTLSSSVDESIEYRKNAPQNVQDDVSTAIVGLIKTIQQKIEDFDLGVSSDEVIGLLENLGNSDINAENLVNAYLGSDAFKNNVASVVDAKNEQIKELQDKVNNVTARNVFADKDDKVIPIKKGK